MNKNFFNGGKNLEGGVQLNFFLGGGGGGAGGAALYGGRRKKWVVSGSNIWPSLGLPGIMFLQYSSYEINGLLLLEIV